MASDRPFNPEPRYSIRWSPTFDAFILERGPGDVLRFRQSEMQRMFQYLHAIAFNRLKESTELDNQVPQTLRDLWAYEAPKYPPKGRPSAKDLDDLDL